MNPILAAALIIVTGAGGQVIEISPMMVVSLRTPSQTAGSRDYFGPGIKCLIATVDGKYHAVIEDCTTVRGKLEAQQ